MEFLVGMAVGTVIAVWAVVGTRPKRRLCFDEESGEWNESASPKTSAWRKEIGNSHPIGELEYLEGIERYENDRTHQPYPLPPPRGNRDVDYDWRANP
jgi:hypothetical protein